MSSSPTNTNTRSLEPTIVRDLRTVTSYASYLRLDLLLGAQQLASDPRHHDEMLFIIQHQTSELWLKLVLHELTAALANLRTDDLAPALKQLARVKHIQRAMTEQWSVLATLTPAEFAEFRPSLGPSSGFQSSQYRAVEFILGNKNAEMIEVFSHDAAAAELLTGLLEAPSLYDEYLRYLARQGFAVPPAVLERDVRIAHVFDEDLVQLFRTIYENPREYWAAYEACEELVDIEDNFQFWRFRHLKTVERTIGFKPGTGGSSGVNFLRQALSLTFFPELYAVRTEIGQ